MRTRAEQPGDCGPPRGGGTEDRRGVEGEEGAAGWAEESGRPGWGCPLERWVASWVRGLQLRLEPSGCRSWAGRPGA